MKNRAQNLARICRRALNILRLAKSSKREIKARRWIANTSDQYRELLLGLAINLMRSAGLFPDGCTLNLANMINLNHLIAIGWLASAGWAYAADPLPATFSENLMGEACEVRVRDDLTPAPGAPTDEHIFCGGKVAGRVNYGRFLSSGNLGGDAARAALLSQYHHSRMEKMIAVAATCASPQWLAAASGAAVAIFACQRKPGGWPQLVVAGARQGALAVADGSPALLPVLLRIAGLSEAQIEIAASKTYLQTLWGRPVVLASAADMDRFRQLMREARSASEHYYFSQAEDLFRKALDMQGKLLSSDDPAVADTLGDLALAVSSQGRAEEAQALFRRAEAIVQKSPFEADRVRLFAYQSYDAANRGDYVAALKGAQLTTAARRKLAGGTDQQTLLRDGSGGIDRAELAMALDFEAKITLRNDDPVSAGALASEALQVLSQTDSAPRWWKADIMMTLGELSMVQGRLSAAETYYTAALDIRRQFLGEGMATVPVLAALGRAYQAEGMNSSAIVTFRSAFQVARSLPQSAGVLNQEQLIPFATAITDYAATLKDERSRQGLYAEAFDAFQMARSSLIDQTIAKAQARLASDDSNIATLVEALQDAQRQVEVARVELALEQALPDQERSAIAETRLQRTMADSGQRARTLGQQLAKQFPAYHQLANPSPLQLTEVRQRLGEREALVSFIVGKKQSFIQITRRAGNTVAKINQGAAALGESVKVLRRALEVEGSTINAFNMRLARELYQELFGELEKQLQGVDHLIVAATGPLASLPFALLITAEPRNDNYAEAAWLGQRFAISHTPSIQAFYTLRSAPARRPPSRMMLAFGAPALLGTPPQQSAAALAAARDGCRPLGPMNGNILRAMNPLPDTAHEISAVERILGAGSSSVFLGTQATEDNFRQQSLEDYRILYFATHGLLPGELRCQTEPALVLSPPVEQAATKARDGLLDASEIAALKLNADLVVLSACNTAGGGGKFGGEALAGLAESFFFAGARALVVSHWQVPSAATAQLISAMFETFGPQIKGSASAALKAAQARLIAQKSTAHPFFWGAFVVVGDGMVAVGAGR